MQTKRSLGRSPSPWWGALGPEAVIGARKLALEQESLG